MSSSIFRPFPLGKEIFTPIAFSEKEFVMDYELAPGGGVPPHFHEHCEELFELKQGEMSFKVDGQQVVKQAGDTLTVPRGIVHSISNTGKERVLMRVTYRPCADVHRMFEILAQLDQKNPGAAINLVKYFYLVPHLGLKPFSTVSPLWVNALLAGVASGMGKVLGWKKLIQDFNKP